MIAIKNPPPVFARQIVQQAVLFRIAKFFFQDAHSKNHATVSFLFLEDQNHLLDQKGVGKEHLYSPLLKPQIAWMLHQE